MNTRTKSFIHVVGLLAIANGAAWYIGNDGFMFVIGCMSVVLISASAVE